jgi:branched-chain amino acid transport system ATP-binding protein
MSELLLQGLGLTKQFGGLTAVNNVTFDLKKGEILGLIGPNGAGKTTMFNVINGVYPATKGEVIYKGENVTGKRTYDMAHLGMARTHQIVKPLSDLSVIENVIVGACFGGAGKGLGDASKVADEVMEFLGIADRAEQLAGSLNVAQKKRLELARALAAEPDLLLLDEVLAGLNPSEIANMVETVKRIRDRGVTIIMIEHVMHAVMNVSDRMIVLDYGELIAEGTPEEIQNDERVIEAYLGDPKLAEKLMASAQ